MRNGGIIGSRNLPGGSTAGGVWSISRAQQGQDGGYWPTASSTIKISALIVAGGGGGGGATVYGQGSGGGAGGCRVMAPQTFTTGTVCTVSLGAGGATRTNGVLSYLAGSPDIVTIVSTHGGGGADDNSRNGKAGGSGSGSYGYPNGVNAVGAAQAVADPIGNAPAQQGYAGGAGFSDDLTFTNSGGGGGGGAVGGNAGGTASGQGGGLGGAGLYSSISGSSVAYAGGGGGGTTPINMIQGFGGVGGGGIGGIPSNGLNPVDSTAGEANTGGGGGGGSSSTSTTLARPGGSGVVILNMRTGFYTGTSSGSPVVTAKRGYTIVTFNASGTYTA